MWRWSAARHFQYRDLHLQVSEVRPAGRAQEKREAGGFPFSILAEWTGLEPATPGVTGRYSNQLNYHSELQPRGAQAPEKLASPQGFEPRLPP